MLKRNIFIILFYLFSIPLIAEETEKLHPIRWIPYSSINIELFNNKFTYSNGYVNNEIPLDIFDYESFLIGLNLDLLVTSGWVNADFLFGIEEDQTFLEGKLEGVGTRWNLLWHKKYNISINQLAGIFVINNSKKNIDPGLFLWGMYVGYGLQFNARISSSALMDLRISALTGYDFSLFTYAFSDRANTGLYNRENLLDWLNFHLKGEAKLYLERIFSDIFGISLYGSIESDRYSFYSDILGPDTYFLNRAYYRLQWSVGMGICW